MSEFIKGVEETNTDKIQLEEITFTPTLEKVTDASQEAFTANVTNNNGAANVELMLKLLENKSDNTNSVSYTSFLESEVGKGIRNILSNQHYVTAIGMMRSGSPLIVPVTGFNITNDGTVTMSGAFSSSDATSSNEAYLSISSFIFTLTQENNFSVSANTTNYVFNKDESPITVVSIESGTLSGTREPYFIYYI